MARCPTCDSCLDPLGGCLNKACPDYQWQPAEPQAQEPVCMCGSLMKDHSEGGDCHQPRENVEPQAQEPPYWQGPGTEGDTQALERTKTNLHHAKLWGHKGDIDYCERVIDEIARLSAPCPSCARMREALKKIAENGCQWSRDGECPGCMPCIARRALKEGE